MPATTPGWNIPYPVISDPVQVHTDMQAMGMRLDDVLEASWEATQDLGGIGDYNPTWTGPTSLSLGDGVKTGRYTKIGHVTNGFVQIIRAANTNQGTNVYNFGLPFAQLISPPTPHPDAGPYTVSGSGFVRIGTAFHPLAVFGTSTGSVGATFTSTGTRLGPGTRPGGGSWQAGDEFFISFSYISQTPWS